MAGNADPIRSFGRSDLLLIAAFVLFAAWLASGFWPNPETKALALNGADQIMFEWWLAYDTTIWSGDFSFFTERLNAPEGVNALANTSVAALGAALAPITAAFGSSTTFAVLVAFNLAATSIAWYVLFRRGLSASRIAAGVAASFCGFAPAMIAHSNGHLHFTAGFLVPGIVGCALRLGRLSTVEPTPLSPMLRSVLLLVVVIALQVFIGEEVLFLTAATLAVATVIYAGLSRPPIRQVVVFGSALTLAAALSACLLAYPLWVQFAGPQAVKGPLFDPGYFSTDLASFSAFSPLSIAGTDASERLTPGLPEAQTFFGWPLLTLILALALMLRRNPLALSGALTMAVMFAFSLGPELVINTQRTGIPGPFRLLQGLPLVDLAIPIRFSLAGIPLTAFLLAAAIEKFQGRPQLLLLILIGGALLPLVPDRLPTVERDAVPRYYSEGHWRGCASEREVLVPIPLPDPSYPEPMRYAAATLTRFALPEGHFIGPYGADGSGSMGTWKTKTSALFTEVAETGAVPEVTSEMRMDAQNDLKAWEAKCVVLTRHPHFDALRQTAEMVLGPGIVVSDAVIWRAADMP